jgi:hypothetical protein
VGQDEHEHGGKSEIEQGAAPESKQNAKNERIDSTRDCTKSVGRRGPEAAAGIVVPSRRYHRRPQDLINFRLRP